MLDQYFQISERKSSIRTELLAGTTTFLTMAYIILVNPAVLADAGMDREALVAVTCLVSAFSCILMGLIPRVPIALAPGMGLNAFFAYTLVGTYGISWQVALGMVVWAGLLFLLLGFFGAREKIVAAIPQSLISAIGAGIGLFLMFIGMKNLGLVVDHPATLVTLGTFDIKVVIGLLGLLLTIILMLKNIAASILIGIVFSTMLAFAFDKGVIMPTSLFELNFNISTVAFQADIMGALKWSLVAPIFALVFVDMFDTLGTLVACAHEAKLVKKDGTIGKIRQMLGVDAIATIMSGVLGSSPTTSYVESASGIAAGGRTGLTAVITGLWFLSGILFVPIFSVVPAYATAPALIVVGILMAKQLKNVPFDKLEESIPVMLMITTMVFSFKIAVGLAMGFLSWGLIKLFLFKTNKISLVMWIIMILSFLSLIVK